MKKKKSSIPGIILCGKHISPGENATLELTSANLFTHTSLTVPVHVFCGKEPGPTLLVTAAIHGDEINGVEIVKKLIASKKIQRLKGVLIAVPILNIFGFIHLSRYLPDRRDLNRSFPGSSKGSLASRLAKVYNAELIKKATHLIDLHTGTNHRFNFPQIRANLQDPETCAMASAFGAPVAIQSGIRDGSLRSAGSNAHIPSLVYEAGEALRLDDASIKLGLKGILNVMSYLDMISSSKVKKTQMQTQMAKSMQWVRAPISGMFYPKKKLGHHVEKQEIIGILSDPFGQQKEAVRSEVSGIVIGQHQLPLVTEGDALFNIARFDEPKKVRKRLADFQEDWL